MAEARFEAMTSAFGNNILQNHQKAALFRSTDGTYRPGFAVNICTTLVAGYQPVGFQNLVNGKLKYVPKEKENPEGVFQIMTKASKEWKVVEIEL